MTSQQRQQFWLQHVDAWQTTSLSGAAFCKQHDLNYTQFSYWRRKFLTSAPDSASAGFAQVAQLETTLGTSDGLTVHLPNGMYFSGVSTDNLNVVLALLRQL